MANMEGGEESMKMGKVAPLIRSAHIYKNG